MHNHVFQVKPRVALTMSDCPACSTINAERMDRYYAHIEHAVLKTERELRI